ncbi:MAG: V-type ATP synthase subunit F [Candidatus Heimdallarchaeaceae archaeon]
MVSPEIKNKAFVIGTRESVKGFNLIGVSGREVSSVEEAISVLDEVIQKDYSIILISASIAYLIEKELDVYRKEVVKPIVVISDLNMKADLKELEKKFKQFIGF